MKRTHQQDMRPVIIWLAVICSLIVAVVAVGGATRLTGSGLSMVDWQPIMGVLPPMNAAEWQTVYEAYQASPQYRLVNEGMSLASFKSIFIWEYVHRLLARAVGLAYLVPFLVFLASGRVRGALAGKLAFGFLLGGFQGVLGWYMVKSGLIDQPHVSHLRLAAHLSTAMILFGYLLWIMCSLAASGNKATAEPRPRLRAAVTAFIVLVAVQIVYGAFMAGLRAGLAFNTFPTMLGFWIPPGLLSLEPVWANVLHNTTTIQFIHRGLGWMIGAAAIGLWCVVWFGRLRPGQKALLHGLLAATVLQFALGVITLVFALPIVPAVLHQVGGCALLGLALALLHSLGGRPVAEAASVPAHDTLPAAPAGSEFAGWKVYLSLAKPRIVSMVLVTTTIGYLLGGRGDGSLLTLCCMLAGTAAAAGGSAVLNNFLDRDLDAKMERTAGRALPAGVVEPGNALAFGALLVLGGVSLLVWRVNLPAAFLVLLTAFLYVIVYTPLKRVTWLNTSIGAIPGALPPVNGWVAATGAIEPRAWILFLILFAWQHPHFYAIAWMYKEDYARAGFRMLSVVEPGGKRMFRHIIIFLIVLLGVSVLPVVAGLTGRVYLVGALMAGALFLGTGVVFARTRDLFDARRVLRASIVYLPALLTLILADLTF